jgi:hypothetical protein
MEAASQQVLQLIDELKTGKINPHSLGSLKSHNELFVFGNKLKILIASILLIGLTYYSGDLLIDKKVSGAECIFDYSAKKFD